MKRSISTLKSLFESGDKPSQTDFEDLIDSFVHKDAGVTIRNITINSDGHFVFTFSDNTIFTVRQLPEALPISFITDLQNVLNDKIDKDGNKQLSTEDFTSALKVKLEQLENYVHPVTHNILEIENLQTSLDGKVNATGNETINGQKVFSELIELLDGIKLSSFSGTGLRNLVVQADGTVDVKAIATDVFVENTQFDEATKKLTLEFVNGTAINIDLSSLEDDITGFQSSIVSIRSAIASLEDLKLNRGGFVGTAQDLDDAKRDKSAFAKSITDVSGNLELQGDQELPSPTHYYGTDEDGVKGYHKIDIDSVENLQTSLDGKVATTGNETITGQKTFNEIVSFLSGLKISNFSGTGLRNIVVQADGTLAAQAIATDVFVNNTSYDDDTKMLTLSFVDGTAIEIDLSDLEEDLTGLQAAIDKNEADITSLQDAKLDKGTFTGTAEDLNNAKRDKSAFAKSITDISGNLELQGDQELPSPTHYYGTNESGIKGYHKISIDKVENLQTSLDGKVATTGNETIAGMKIFSQIVELLDGLKISNFSGSGLRNLVVQADGTVSAQAIAADVFVNDTMYDDTTKILTLGFVGGTTIDVDLSSLEEDLTGLQASIALLESNVVSLQATKLDNGGYVGTGKDLDDIKRDKSAFAKSITDISGNLELQGDQTNPGSSYYYGTDGAGVKGYHEIEPIYFNVTNLFLGGSTNNIEDQEFFVDLSSYGILKPGHQLELNNIEFRGDFSLETEFVDVGLNTTVSTKSRLGVTGGLDSSQWQSAQGIGDGSTVDIIQLPTEEIGFTIYVSPSTAVNFSPFGMSNWWELRADVQFKII
ncbi:hypothetical protein [Dokdonia sp.]|uniref:hypothetical protein n=1 Tax=Dokdonia sp. TaxID=2024995 RepID=UPI00326554D2